MYNANHAPYQNLPNGQHTQNQLDSRYPTTNTTFSGELVTPTKPSLEIQRRDKVQNQDHGNSNSDSSSDSDDSNNDSDSSSDTDGEKEDKENCSNRIVKPFRINLSKVSKFIILWNA